MSSIFFDGVVAYPLLAHHPFDHPAGRLAAAETVDVDFARQDAGGPGGGPVQGFVLEEKGDTALEVAQFCNGERHGPP